MTTCRQFVVFLFGCGWIYKLVVLILILHPKVSSSQNLESIGKESPVTLGGNFSLNQILAFGNQQSGREPYSYVASGGLNLSLYGWSIPLSFSFSNERFTYQQPFNNGFTASTRIVEISEDGLYKVEVTTAKGCTGDAEFLLQTSQDLLEAQFITVHEAFEGDTLVLIDVTWPVADNVEWKIPEAMEVIGLKNGDLMGRFDSKGTYSVGMHAYLGLCYDYVEKTIEILEEQESESEGGRLGFQEELLDFTLAPNPTTGNFNVHIELAEAREISLSVINGVTGKILARVSDAGESSYSVPFNLAPLGGGVYVLRLDLVSGTHYIRFIVK